MLNIYEGKSILSIIDLIEDPKITWSKIRLVAWADMYTILMPLTFYLVEWTYNDFPSLKQKLN